MAGVSNERSDAAENRIRVRSIAPEASDEASGEASAGRGGVELSWSEDSARAVLGLLLIALILVLFASLLPRLNGAWFAAVSVVCVMLSAPLYQRLAIIFNRTTVTADARVFTRRRGPLPIERSVRVATSDITSVFTTELSNGRATVVVARRDGPTIIVVDRMADVRAAESVARLLVEFLRLPPE